MLNDFMTSFTELFSTIEKQNTYMTSRLIKEKINNFYKAQWLPISEDFRKKFGDSAHIFLENNFFELYKSTKTNILVKKRTLEILKRVEPVLDSLQIETIRKFGRIIEYDKRKQIIEELTKQGFNGTLSYLRNSEIDFERGSWKNVCFNARLSLEEFMREFREKVTKKSVQKGNLGNHINPIRNKVGLKDGEVKLIEQGFYGFLSEKGGHATKDMPDREDASIAIYIIYIASDYLLKKYGTYI